MRQRMTSKFQELWPLQASSIFLQYNSVGDICKSKVGEFGKAQEDGRVLKFKVLISGIRKE